nr:hypothetical protein [Tanacetum cinerariifolium]
PVWGCDSTGGSNEGTGTKLGVPDESTVVSATSSEGIGIKPDVPNEENDITEENVILEWGDEQDGEHFDDDNDDVEKDDKDGDADEEGDDHVSDIQDADDEDVKTKSDEDEIYKYKIRVHKDKDVEMENAKVKESDKGDEEVIDAAKEDDKKTLEVKDDTKKTKIPLSSSSLSISAGFGDQFLKLSSDSSLVSTVKDSADAYVSSLIDSHPTRNSPDLVSISTEEYDLKSALYQSMNANKSFNRNPTNHRLYHALMEVLIEDENAMDKGVTDTVKDHKRKHDDDDDEDPPAGPNQGKASTKGSKTGMFASTKEPVEEPIIEVVLVQPEQPWFNQMVSALKDPLTFNDLMTTPIDFSKYVLHGLKIENLTQDILLGPAFNLLKGTYSSSIKLEYNFQE